MPAGSIACSSENRSSQTVISHQAGMQYLASTVPAPPAGTFACGYEDAEALQPGLHVEGFGTVALPLSHEQGALLQKTCCMAPFGRGEKTIWDASV